MITISVLYPRTSGTTFDHVYYTEKHMPMVRARLKPVGLLGDTLLRASATLDGSAPAYELLGFLSFASAEEMQAALAAHGAEILGDIPNFTNAPPLIQLNVPV